MSLHDNTTDTGHRGLWIGVAIAALVIVVGALLMFTSGGGGGGAGGY
jgi:uncharacterized membrane protein